MSIFNKHAHQERPYIVIVDIDGTISEATEDRLHLLPPPGKGAQWKKRRKQELRQKALEAFYDAFELSRIEPGTTARIATKGDLMIVMFRQERAEKGESA